MEKTRVSTDAASSVTLALLGDVMLGRGVHPAPETSAFLKPFLTSADLALANLESPLTDSLPEGETTYVLCAPPADAQYLADAGLDLLSISNNHNLDCGLTGLKETEATLTEAGLGFIGPGPDPVYRSVHGISMAFLAFDATRDQFDLESAVQAVCVPHDSGAVVIVSVHWGEEYQAGASDEQEEIARQLAGAGAELIWGHHPHVLQPSAWINDGKTLVLYSLGNALFDQYGLESTRQSALVLVTLNPGGVTGLAVIPFSIDVQNSRIVEAGDRDIQRIEQSFK